MKKKIHPKYQLATVKCACGAVYQLNSTKSSFEIELCKNCAPVFTGQEEAKMALGQVEKFRKRQAKKRQ